MNEAASHQRSVAMVGIILALPITLIFLIAGFNIEPFNGFLKTLFATDNTKMHIFGLFVLLAAMALLPIACILNLAAIGRSLRAGNSVVTNPANLLVTIGLLAFIITLISGFVVDQYPCWIGLPNCD